MRVRADGDERKHEHAARRSSAIEPTNTWHCFALTFSWFHMWRRMGPRASNALPTQLYQNGAAQLAPGLLFVG
jgi:hypothetical protein